MAIEDRIIGAESGGDPQAKNPNSTATGPGQFIDSTWLGMMAKNRPDLVQGKSPDEILALRGDPALSREMTAAYARDNTKTLSDAGLPTTPGNVYLAHFAGPTGAVNLLKSDPSAPAASVLDPAAVKANPFLRGMSVADLQSWASRKVGGPAIQSPPVQTGPASAPVPAAQGGMLSGLPGLSEPGSAGTGTTPAAAPQATGPGAQQPAGQSMPDPMAQPQMAAPQPLNMPLTAQAKARLFAALAAPRQ